LSPTHAAEDGWEAASHKAKPQKRHKRIAWTAAKGGLLAAVYKAAQQARFQPVTAAQVFEQFDATCISKEVVDYYKGIPERVALQLIRRNLVDKCNKLDADIIRSEGAACPNSTTFSMSTFVSKQRMLTLVSFSSSVL
jgi:hypothetical protein